MRYTEADMREAFKTGADGHYAFDEDSFGYVLDDIHASKPRPIVNYVTPRLLEPKRLHPTPFVHVDVASGDLPDLMASARVFPAPRGNVIVYHPSVGVIAKNGVSTGRSL